MLSRTLLFHVWLKKREAAAFEQSDNNQPHTEEHTLPKQFHWTVQVCFHIKAVCDVLQWKNKALMFKGSFPMDLGSIYTKGLFSFIGSFLQQELKWLSKQSLPGAACLNGRRLVMTHRSATYTPTTHAYIFEHLQLHTWLNAAMFLHKLAFHDKTVG